MINKLFIFLCLFALLYSSCNRKNKNTVDTNTGKEINSSNLIEDTINIDDIFYELDDDVWNRVKLIFSDKNNNIINELNNSQDTFYLEVGYNSLKYPNLTLHHKIDIYSESNNCFFSQIGKNKFRLIVDSKSQRDTIEYEIYLKSDRFLFKNISSIDGKIELTSQMRLGTFYETVGW